MQVSNNLREQVKQLQKSFELGVEMTGHLLTYLDEYPEFESVIANHMRSIHFDVLCAIVARTSSLLEKTNDPEIDKTDTPHDND